MIISLLTDIPTKLPASEAEKRFIQEVQESHEKVRDYLRYKRLKWAPSKKIK
jgi:hypothetical protein